MKLKYAKPLSNFAFDCNLRHYNLVKLKYQDDEDEWCILGSDSDLKEVGLAIPYLRARLTLP